jgi:hypothetical protein
LSFLIGLKPLIIPTELPASTTVTFKPVIEPATENLNPTSLQIARIDSSGLDSRSITEIQLEDEQFRIMRQMIKQQDEAVQSFQREKLRKRAATPTASARR